MPGDVRTLLGHKTSEILIAHKVGVKVNNCDLIHEATNALDKKSAPKTTFPKGFDGLGKLRAHQLKLHQKDGVAPLAQPLRSIPFSRRQKVTEKLKQLEELYVIEKVNEPTNWVNPLVVLEKHNGDIRICVDMKQANRSKQKRKPPLLPLNKPCKRSRRQKSSLKLT